MQVLVGKGALKGTLLGLGRGNEGSWSTPGPGGLLHPECLGPSEKIHISKLLHLINIHSLNDLLVIEKDPRFLSFRLARNMFTDEGDIVAVYTS